MRRLLGGRRLFWFSLPKCGVYFAFLFPNAAFIRGQHLKEEIRWSIHIHRIKHNITKHCDPILLNQLETTEAKLDELYDYITEGSILRSKVRWFEHGEESSKYCFGLEKRNKIKMHIQKLSANPHSSEEITEFNEVQNELKRFYKNL